MRSIRAIRMTLVVLVAMSLSVPLAGAKPPTGPPGRSAHCFDKKDEALPISISVEGEQATGHYSLPETWPTAFVVIGHGYGHSSYSWIEHMKRMSRDLGVVAVAMDYRGTVFQPQPWPEDGVPSTRGWRVMEGAEDSVAITEFFLSICGSIKKTVIFGVSMGGNATGLALALAADERREDGGPLFDYWIDAEGVNNVIETYFEARGVAPFNTTAKNAYEDIKEEMGGKDFEQDPAIYADHSNMIRIEDIKASGVKGVVVIHGLNDGLVPHNQGREFVTELLATGIPVDMFTVVRSAPGSEDGTTLVGGAGLAGHASERSTTHSVMTTAFAQLRSIILDGSAPGPYREFVVDNGKIYP
jgi:pimeloyl-ACP methyl ester carboxylesterase